MTENSPKSVDFQTFVLSLASSAMLHLGRVPDPSGQQLQPNLALAQQTIDILSMLRDKTHGNLNGDEAGLLERILHDLRMAYIEESRNQAS